MEQKKNVSEQTPVEGEFSSNEILEDTSDETFVDLGEFKEDKFGFYKIKKGDSLLIISFKLYGDYRKWWVFKHFNPGVNENVLIPGNTLKYPISKQKFVWRPKGNPYLILNGDSLTGISLKKYRDAIKWTKIWDNNMALIKDPDNIFAGFTIFYVPDPKVIELASLSEVGKVPVYKSELKKKVTETPKIKETKIIEDKVSQSPKESEKEEVSETEKIVEVKEEVVEEVSEEVSEKLSEEVSEEDFETASNEIDLPKDEASRAPSSIESDDSSAEIISDELVPSEPAK